VKSSEALMRNSGQSHAAGRLQRVFKTERHRLERGARQRKGIMKVCSKLCSKISSE